MSTTIHPGGPTGPQPSTANARPVAGGDADATAAGRPGASQAQAQDQVQLTESARAIGAAARGTDAPVDTKHVERIRQAIANGTYKIDPQRVADRLVALEKQIG
ncbi:MAG: flagellar biosynthesis anti-sigma factor FlgM [Rhodanobacteraceae bacterium]